MEKRVLLAIVLSFVVLYGYQAMFPPPEFIPPPTTDTAVEQSAEVPPAAGGETPTGATPQEPVEAAPAALTADSEELVPADLAANATGESVILASETIIEGDVQTSGVQSDGIVAQSIGGQRFI